nr:hypothetical protein [Tanacetum cinerariifolium]
MADSEHSTVSDTSISSDSDLTAWGIPLIDADEVPEIDPYEEVVQQGQAAPPSPAYAPNPIELEEHVPVYVLEPEEDPKEDPFDHAADADEDEEEEFSKDDDDKVEEHLTLLLLLLQLLIPSLPLKRQSRLRPMKVARLLALLTPPPSPVTPLSSLLPQISSPPLHVPSPPTTSPTYTEVPLGYKAARIRLRAASPLPSPPLLLPSTSRRADIPTADIPPRKRLLLTSFTPVEVRESSAAATARHPRSNVDRRDKGYLGEEDPFDAQYNLFETEAWIFGQKEV